MQHKMNHTRVAKTIRSLDNTEIFHECYDIIDEALEDILAAYGVYESFSPSEEDFVRNYLYRRASQAEIQEAVRWATEEQDPILLSIPDRPSPKPWALKLEHQAWDREKCEKIARLLGCRLVSHDVRQPLEVFSQ